MNIDTLHQYFIESSGVCTDTRKIIKNCIFFALKGDNFNGNTYALEALSKGARYSVVDDVSLKDQEGLIYVQDVLVTLQKLATFHRRYLDVPIIALTGSNGKTTTKELINSVLSTQFKTTATLGNLNNHIGVPLTLLKMNSGTDIGIVEMGANHLKEIALLSSIAEPNYGLITNFGKAHLEGFGSLKGVIKGKSELYDYLKDHKGVILYNTDDSKQVEQVGDYNNTIAYNSNTVKNYLLKLKQTQPTIVFTLNDQTVNTQLSGAYNYSNILMALAIAANFEIPLQQIKKGIEAYEPKNNRSQWISKGGNTYYLDAYNANPSSMAVSIENFAKFDSDNKMIVLGDMFELGTETAIEHQTIANLAKSHSFESIYLVGEHFFSTDAASKNILKFKTFDAFKSDFLKKNFKDYNIFIKGSRGMALERLLDEF